MAAFHQVEALLEEEALADLAVEASAAEAQEAAGNFRLSWLKVPATLLKTTSPTLQQPDSQSPAYP